MRSCLRFCFFRGATRLLKRDRAHVQRRRSGKAFRHQGNLEAGEFAPFVNALRKHEAYRPKPENILMSLAPASAGGFEDLYSAAASNQASLYLLQFPPKEKSRVSAGATFRRDLDQRIGFTIQSVSPIFAQMRVRKSAMELQLMQHAIDISIEAHQRARRLPRRQSGNTKSMRRWLHIQAAQRRQLGLSGHRRLWTERYDLALRRVSGPGEIGELI